MMRKTFGKFQNGGPVGDSPTIGEPRNTKMPSIAGSPLPNPGMKSKTLGDVFPGKEKFSPKQYAARNAAMKRMKSLPRNSPLGPITSGAPRPQGQNPQPQPQPQQESGIGGVGEQWMGELWQGLTMDEGQSGFAGGGSVNPGMDIYNKAMSDLESGGVGGYAHGGMVGQSREIASKGRNGDTMLMHINPQELSGLQSLLGPVTVNPDTGNPEAFAWVPFFLAAAAGTGIGGAIGGEDGALKGLMIGATIGTGLGAVAAPAAAAGTAAAAAPVGTGTVLASSGSAAPTLASLSAVPGLTAAGAAPEAALAPGAGVLAPGFGGGVTAANASAMGAAPTVQGTMLAGQQGAGLSASGGGVDLGRVSKALQSGLGSMKQEEGGRPAPPPMPSSNTPPPQALASVSPFEKRRSRIPKNRLPGSGRIGSGIGGIG